MVSTPSLLVLLSMGGAIVQAVFYPHYITRHFLIAPMMNADFVMTTSAPAIPGKSVVIRMCEESEVCHRILQNCAILVEV